MSQTYRDREEAGHELTRMLERYRRAHRTIVLGLPRGGVPVAAVIAEELELPLDVLVVRKLGVPGREELAMGAIASGGGRTMNEEIVRAFALTAEDVEAVEEHERAELERRTRAYRGDRPYPKVDGQTVILVDDGLATGATMKAAVEALEDRNPLRIVVAVPVAPEDTLRDMKRRVDAVVCPRVPTNFMGVGQWYRDFTQTTDDDVQALLDAARRRQAA